MIKRLNNPFIIERYEEYVSINNRRFELRWKSKVLQYYTCGSNSKLVECLDFIDESLSIKELFENDKPGIFLSLDEFNSINPEETLDLKCNCHGFTFANGKFFINTHFVDSILEDEFTEVINSSDIVRGDFDVICFKNQFNEWVHSCKFKFELFIQKEGIRKFSIHRTFDEIQKIEEYKNTTPHFFKRNERNCHGICLNAIGEEHIKTFANNA